MLATKNILYVHTPKMGGTTIKNYLANNIEGPKIVIGLYDRMIRWCQELLAEQIAEREVDPELLQNKDVVFLNGDKHSPIDPSLLFLDLYGHKWGIDVGEVEKILVCARNPYDTAVSSWKWAVMHKACPEEISFSDYLRTWVVAYYSERGIERYYRSACRGWLDKIVVLRFENLQYDLQNVLGLKSEIPWLNKTVHEPFATYYRDNAETEEIVYNLFYYLFDHGYYKRGEGLDNA